MYAPRDQILLHGSHLKTFIETGTYHGDTALWASKYWVVHTVELSPKLYRKHWGPNITSYLGDSRSVLQLELHDLINSEPCVFWLDGHWFDHGDDPAGTEEDCPLIEELQIITTTPQDHVIFIDDAHLIKEKQKPYESWPDLTEVLRSASGYHFYEYVENTLLLKRSGK